MLARQGVEKEEWRGRISICLLVEEDGVGLHMHNKQISRFHANSLPSIRIWACEMEQRCELFKSR